MLPMNNCSLMCQQNNGKHVDKIHQIQLDFNSLDLDFILILNISIFIYEFLKNLFLNHNVHCQALQPNSVFSNDLGGLCCCSISTLSLCLYQIARVERDDGKIERELGNKSDAFASSVLFCNKL